jgi:hypothetical protein
LRHRRVDAWKCLFRKGNCDCDITRFLCGRGISKVQHTVWSKACGLLCDGSGVASHVGVMLSRKLAGQIGLIAALSRALIRRGFVPMHDRGRVLADGPVR